MSWGHALSLASAGVGTPEAFVALDALGRCLRGANARLGASCADAGADSGAVERAGSVDVAGWLSQPSAKASSSHPLSAARA